MTLLPFSRIAAIPPCCVLSTSKAFFLLSHEPNQKDLLRERKAVCQGGRSPELTLISKETP